MSNAASTVDYSLVLDRISFLLNRYEEYRPAQWPPYAEFTIRLEEWLKNTSLTEDHRKVLFEFVPEIFFIGSDEFFTLYRAAYTRVVLPWIFEQATLNFVMHDYQSRLEDEVGHTWFCPITDSMHISDFYHANHLSGWDFRPDWRSLQRFGDILKINTYIATNSIRRIVLLEDFVGTGSQVGDIVQLCNMVSVPVHIVALIACPEGIAYGNSVAHGNLSFSVVLPLQEEDMISENPVPNEAILYSTLRDICRSLEPIMCNPANHFFGPFGFGNTGSLTVMYTNCPDNTLPLIHQERDHWKPLFPRSRRIGQI